ncbi:BrnA antitoxin family protein [Xenorhabdus bovienii]|nr:BrnA antitoxin family protein [Xenorhabdus bovienii]
MSIVRYKRSDLPPLTENRESELKALSGKPDSNIDYSDIAPLNEAFWKNATQGQFYRPVKTQASVRIDADVLAWLKEAGKGYQTRLNAILREAMMRDLHRK